ncbi:MAG: nuclear transport factor 2 family protein [Gemmatimonadales bacterium]
MDITEERKALREQYGQLIDRFGKAWERGQPDEMPKVFTDDGVFVPSPFDAPIRGVTAIAEYWRSVPFEQAEISFRFGEIFVAGPWFSTEIKCTFRRRRTGPGSERLCNLNGHECASVAGKSGMGPSSLDRVFLSKRRRRDRNAAAVCSGILYRRGR